jgi:hypothetical protein
MVTERTNDTSQGLEYYLDVSDSRGPRTIRWSRTVLEEIRQWAVEQFLSIPRGGLEIGGVLYGDVSADVLTITAHRPLAIDYVTGPSFVLSTADEDRLARLLADSQSGVNLEHHRPVGWYHTHTRSDVQLTEADIAVHERFFPSADQIAVVIKPHKFEPAQVAIYARTALTPLSEYAGFALEPWLGSEREGAEALAPASQTSVRAPAVVLSSPPVEESESLKPKRKPRRVLLLAAATICCLALAAIAVVRTNTHGQSPPIEPFDLGIQGREESLKIVWALSDQHARNIRFAELQIVDGRDTTTVPLSVSELRRGAVTYVRRSETVEARLRIHRRDGQVGERIARFVGPVRTAEGHVTSHVEVPKLPAQVELNVPPEEPHADEKSEQRSRLRVVVPPAANPMAELRVGMDVRAPVVGSLSPAGEPEFTLHQPGIPPPPRPNPAKATPARAVVGRAIWTGSLPKDGVLLIESSRPSTGTLTGTMPQGPANVRVYPARLADTGVVVYSDREVIEAPSAANGWNLTAYRNDPVRARDIIVIEEPGPQNGWHRLMVRSAKRAVSVIFIDWQERK